MYGCHIQGLRVVGRPIWVSNPRSPGRWSHLAMKGCLVEGLRVGGHPMPPCRGVQIQCLLFVGRPSQIWAFVVVSNKSKALASLVAQCRGTFCFIRESSSPTWLGGSTVIGDYIVCGIKSKASGSLVDLRRVVIYWVGKRGEGRKIEELLNHTCVHGSTSHILNTTCYSAPWGRAKTSRLLVTRVIKGVFPVYLVTMGGMAMDSSFFAFRICICFLRGETLNFRVVSHPMWGVVLTLVHNWARMAAYCM